MKKVYTTINEFLNSQHNQCVPINFVNEHYDIPTYDRISNLDGIKNYITDKYKIVRFALDDEGSNAFALLDLVNKKIVSYSISGSSQFKKFGELIAIDWFDNLSPFHKNKIREKYNLKASTVKITDEMLADIYNKEQ